MKMVPIIIVWYVLCFYFYLSNVEFNIVLFFRYQWNSSTRNPSGSFQPRQQQHSYVLRDYV